MIDKRLYTCPHDRRNAIRRGWDAYQWQGYKAECPYDVQDPKWWFWMNGLEGGAQHQKSISYEMKDVPGWRMQQH